MTAKALDDAIEPDLSMQEVERRPHQALAEQDATINDLLTKVIAYQQQQNRTLRDQNQRLAGLVEALAEGSRARADGKPLEACPYCPDEDERWIFWRQGWQIT